MRSYASMRAAHVADHRALFDRVSLALQPATPPEKAPQETPTDERIVKSGAKDLQLVELFFQYGRGLLIAYSRPGGQAANLQ